MYRYQETKEWYLISHLGSGRATVLELSHTGFDGRRASTGQTEAYQKLALELQSVKC